MLTSTDGEGVVEVEFNSSDGDSVAVALKSSVDEGMVTKEEEAVGAGVGVTLEGDVSTEEVALTSFDIELEGMTTVSVIGNIDVELAPASLVRDMVLVCAVQLSRLEEIINSQRAVESVACRLTLIVNVVARLCVERKWEGGR